MLRCGRTRGLLLGILLVIVTLCAHNGSDYIQVLCGYNFRTQKGGNEQWKHDRLRENSIHGRTAAGHAHGYILTLQYTGQQIAGVRGILSQQCWVSSFKLPLKIVEPFIVDSNLIHSKSLWTKSRYQDTRVFSDFYDMPYYNQQSRKDGQPQIVNWNSFLANAPRKIILLNIENIFQKECLIFKSKTACQNTRHLTTHSHFTSGCETSSNVDEALEYLTNHGFEVVREVCLNCKSGSPPFEPEDIVKYIFGKWKTNEVVLVINRWKFSIQMAPGCTQVGSCESHKPQLKRLQPSSGLLGDAREYIHTAKQGEKMTTVVGVMVRIEWFLIMYKNKTLATIENCLSEVINQLRELAKPDKPVSPVVALDIGKFGSGSFNGTLSRQDISTEYFEQIVSKIKHFVEEAHKPNRLRFEDWEQTYLDVVGSEDRGYVATLQSTVASEADCLIQMGGGHYQQLALTQYLHNHPNKNTQCIYSICTPQPWKNKAAD